MAGVLSPQALCRPASAIKGSALPALAASSRPRAGCTTTSPAAAAAWCRLGHRQRAAAPSLRVAAAAAEAHTEGAAPGDYVEAHYSIIDDGKVFDSSRSEGGKQAQFILGSENLVPGFHQAVGGLKVGESRKWVVRPDDAYGERRDEMMAQIPRSQAPEGLTVGQVVQLSNGMPAVVAAMDDNSITIDANHPLAGKELTFDVEVTRIIPAARLQKATFGAGCFWGPELAFQRVPGVVQTAVGYSQGQTKNPSYQDVCSGTTGHAEVVQVVYDPTEVSYEQLLDAFWARHDPTTLNRQGGDVGTQYRSGIYYHTPEQKAAAEASKAAQNEKLGGKVVTEIEEINNYYVAEEYHQKYLERGGRFGQGQSAEKGCNDPIRCYG